MAKKFSQLVKETRERRVIESTCQAWANRTGLATTATRRPNGRVSYQVAGWPIEGTLIYTANPMPFAMAASPLATDPSSGAEPKRSEANAQEAA